MEVSTYFIKIILLVCYIATIVFATSMNLKLPLESFFTYNNNQNFSIAFELVYIG